MMEGNKENNTGKTTTTSGKRIITMEKGNKEYKNGKKKGKGKWQKDVEK